MDTAYTPGETAGNTKVFMSKTKSMDKAPTLTLMAASIRANGVMDYSTVWVA
jgi:hypothetical protein